jgi:GDPmannose 4,6-dehydratase
MGKTALITGITGQDGSYLAELLLSKGYRVGGLLRPGTANLQRLLHIRDHLHFFQGDLRDQQSLVAALERFQPDEVYNLAAQSLVSASWSEPVLTGDLTGLAVTRLLEAIRTVNPHLRFYQASSSEMFGHAEESPQKETTAFRPRSPYGVAKVYAHYATVNYRESFGLFACCGVCFNHESPRRGPEFVTRKISLAVARIKHGLQKELALGNLDARRDRGYAPDYVEAMWRMLQASTPEDFVVATGVSHSVRDFLEIAFAHAGLHWQDFVRVDPALFRPAEVDLLVGDATRARSRLGWKPSVAFRELVQLMVEADLETVARGAGS